MLSDKDNLFKTLPLPGLRDYLIRRPVEKEFTDCCNEFWWVSSYVAKGLYRNEISYAKDMLEISVRAMFLKIIEWYIGIETNFTVSFGKSGRNMKDCISPDLYERILSTYPDSDPDNIRNSLFIMMELFDEFADRISQAMSFNYNKDEKIKMTEYIKWIYKMMPQNDPSKPGL